MGTRNVTRLAQLSAADLLKMVPDPDQGRDSLLTSRDLLLSLSAIPGQCVVNQSHQIFLLPSFQ